ncbi:hypothetical protein [Salinispira pacifica]
METLDQSARKKLLELAQVLVDQRAARIIVPPNENREGFWFGGGNLSAGPDGSLYLIGRYRNAGDSRTGLGAGSRGLELAIFRSTDGAKSFHKILSFSKGDLNVRDREVVSIEGAKLLFGESGVELFVSTEKSGIGYPEGLEAFLKPGTGVWTIDHAQASSVEELKHAQVSTLVESADPRWLHVKDPVVFRTMHGDTLLYFCTHPFNWSSSNTGMAVRPAGSDSFLAPDYQRFDRGYTWDVAATRVTALCPVPQSGPFAGHPDAALLFYDGAESLRKLEEHRSAVSRPRGYSCEELGGAAFADPADTGSIERLSLTLPLFVSPAGTGCSRYVDVLAAEEGYYVTWQQSQADLSQPLVLNFLSRERAESLLL